MCVSLYSEAVEVICISAATLWNLLKPCLCEKCVCVCVWVSRPSTLQRCYFKQALHQRLNQTQEKYTYTDCISGALRGRLVSPFFTLQMKKCHICVFFFIFWRNFFIRSHMTKVDILGLVCFSCIFHRTQYSWHHSLAPKHDSVTAWPVLLFQVSWFSTGNILQAQIHWVVSDSPLWADFRLRSLWSVLFSEILGNQNWFHGADARGFHFLFCPKPEFVVAAADNRTEQNILLTVLRLQIITFSWLHL